MINIISNTLSGGNDMYYGYMSTDDMNVNINSIEDYNLYKEKIKITSGREPSNDYEVIINEELKDTYKLNKEIDNEKINDKKLVVVGYYKSADNISKYFVNSNTRKYKLIEDSKGVIIYSKDKEKVINSYRELGLKVLDVYEVDKDTYMKEIKDSVNASLIVASIMLGISLIEIILMVRSSFLSRIKEIGIYRAIGVKKSDIYKMFTSESIAITSLASVPGVLFMSYCLHVISGISFVANNYVINFYVVILCIVIMYLFNIIIGLIPVFNTMRKTPSMILSSHQVD